MPGRARAGGYRAPMPDEMGPDRLVPKGLPGARRGYDRGAVETLLKQAREAWAALEAEHRRLLAEIDRAGGLEYLARDLGAVGGEVGRVLADAKQAARGLRERAQADSADRLAAAVAEARRLVAEAEGQSFHLRAEAWATAADLLSQAEEAHLSMIAAADAEVLLIRAGAEQEAYRMTAAARREAQDVVRGARFEAERTVLELQAQPERILPVEPVPVEAVEAPVAQPAPARSRRRRGGNDEVPVVPEEVIRVIQPPGARRLPPGSIDPASYGDALAAEVEALRGTGEVEAVAAPPALPEPMAPIPPGTAAPAPGEAETKAPVRVEKAAAPEEEAPEEEAPAEAPPGEEPGAPGEAAVEAEAAQEPKAPGVVDELFARLRGSASGAEPAGAQALPGAPAPTAEDTPLPPVSERPDALATRERLLLPVQNRALRRAKEAIVELQNAALDSLRVSGAWDGASAAGTLAEALDPVAEEGAEAGAAAAGVLVGGEAPAPVITPRSAGLARAMAGDLAAQVQAAVAGSAGAGPLEVAGSVARVFRAWRSEGAERWVRAAAYAAYHDSLVAGLAVLGVRAVAPVASGLLCPECPAASGASWDPAGSPPRGTARPPAHPDCVCTVTVG